MKNIHLIPTDKARLYLHQGKLYDHKTTMHIADGTQIPQNIHITSNEEIKEGDYYITPNNTILKALGSMVINVEDYKKVILTTDQDLIKEGVQAIDDEFLEWFVKNPSCEEVEVIYGLYNPSGRKVNFEILNQNHSQCVWKYKIIIPKEEPKQHLIDMMRYDEELGLYEEPKQETLEEAIKREYEARKFDSDFPFDPQSFKLGAKWEAKRRYSEEEVKSAYAEGGFAIMRYLEGKECLDVDKWFEQFKKK